ncbi:hypothetical protein HPB49_001214 [Dermacentor silvarum]|uniref:Uncharacterized protein n=1 Tax=Dermacentor silvarum TaxID=543639 RepID=A0ACB8DSK1_DERSI|nr:hypothetical protein HPB49_001214 [Dermacentor silvarum]
MEIPLMWISIPQSLYNKERVVATMRGVWSGEVSVTRGLKQGCPLSPLLHMLYVSQVERQLLKLGLGFTFEYVDGWAQLNSFADKMAALGLSFTSKKSAVLHFSGRAEVDLPFTLPGGQAVEPATEYRYLGFSLFTQPDCTATHEHHLRTASKRAGSVLRREGLWGFNRGVVVCEPWKALGFPALTFSNAFICMSSQTLECLGAQRVIGRLGTGCLGNVAHDFEASEASSNISYDGRLLVMGKHRWARMVLDYITSNGLRTRWMKRLQQLRRKACKKDIHREDFYDNSVGSRLLFEARAAALRTLVYRHLYDPTIASTIGRACGEEDESVEHVVLRCKNLSTFPPEGATLSRVLGFLSADHATSGNGDEVLLAAAMVTQRRLRVVDPSVPLKLRGAESKKRSVGSPIRMKGKQEECYLLSGDILGAWWHFDGKSCRRWNFTSGLCPAHGGGGAFVSREECLATCVGRRGRSRLCRVSSRPDHCYSDQLRFPYFAVTAADEDERSPLRCLKVSSANYHGHRCLVGDNRFQSMRACRMACVSNRTDTELMASEAP